MSVKSDIRDGLISIAKMANGGTGSSAFSAEVTAVDLSTRSCTVISISSQVGTEYTGVWLMPQIDDGLLYTPTIGSTVIVEKNDNLQPFVSMWSQIDAVFYVAGGSTLQIDKSGLQLDGKAFGGIPQVKVLVDKINNLEKLFNDLQNKFAAWTVAPNDGGAALKLLLTVTPPTWNVPQIVKTELSEIENKKVQHGDGS